MITSVYLAGPLFTTAEREFNEKLARLIESKTDLKVVLPQQRASEILARNGSLQDIYTDCVSQAKSADLIIAIVEGSDADSGTCIEMGIAYAAGKPIIGVRSDFRASEDRGLNLMVSNICTALIWDTFVNTEQLADRIVLSIQQINGNHAKGE